MTDRPADSAGVPWEGRRLEPNPAASDDGSAPPALADALRRFGAGSATQVEVVDALRDARLLIPLVAALGEAGEGDHGLVVDKSADLSIVTVKGPDGRDVLPVFSSVQTMARWNAVARPVPTDAVRVALAAASESTDLVVLDPGSESEFAVRRPAVWAIAQRQPWNPSWSDAAVAAEFDDSASSEPDIVGVELTAGDPEARLRAPELTVTLRIRPGLSASELAAILARVQGRWAESVTIAAAVDSLAVRVVAAG